MNLFEDISNSKIKEWVKWAIDIYKRLFPQYTKDIDKLQFAEKAVWSWYGRYIIPQPRLFMIGFQGTIELNTNAYGCSETEFKSTILHELGHYVTFIKLVDDGVIYEQGGVWRAHRGSYSPHGDDWKRIVRVVARDTGIPIERTGSETMQSVDGTTREDAANYKFKCQKCGQEISRARRSKFVDNYQNYSCGICGGKFERIK